MKAVRVQPATRAASAGPSPCQAVRVTASASLAGRARRAASAWSRAMRCSATSQACRSASVVRPASRSTSPRARPAAPCDWRTRFLATPSSHGSAWSGISSIFRHATVNTSPVRSSAAWGAARSTT
ncbi:hypothetical protein ACFQY7_24525 [Actinomadura luteofluorescens]|uniref:hypothetical protein n=1 Tax=Actinomadura luteofluorescens TaxID=46163 RepID=UPI00362E7750